MRTSLPIPCLCLVTDRKLCQDMPLEKKIALAVEGGVDLVQLREKDLPGGQLLELATILRKVTEGHALLFINERVDIGLACGADGVQLGEEAMPVEAAKKVAGNRLIIGRSVHSIEGAIAAEKEGADFLIVGTIFPTSSHPGAQVAGPGLISAIASKVSIPFLGIGGINRSNIGEVTRAGAYGAAVISAILASPHAGKAAKELKDVLVSAWGEAKAAYRRKS